MVMVCAAKQMDEVMQRERRPRVLTDGIVADDEALVMRVETQRIASASAAGSADGSASPRSQRTGAAASWPQDANARRALHRRRRAHRRPLRFDEFVRVVEYDCGHDERELKRQAWRAVARRKPMRRQHPLQPHLQCDVGDLVEQAAQRPRLLAEAANASSADADVGADVLEPETPATPMNPQYACHKAQHRLLAMLPPARDARLVKARVDLRPRSSSQSSSTSSSSSTLSSASSSSATKQQLVLLKSGSTSKRRRQQGVSLLLARRGTAEVVQPQRQLGGQSRRHKNQRQGSAPYWELIVAVLLLLKLFSTVLASVVVGKSGDARSVARRQIAYA